MNSRRNFLSTIGRGLAVLPFAGVARAAMGTKSLVASTTNTGDITFIQYEGVVNNKWIKEVYEPFHERFFAKQNEVIQYVKKVYGLGVYDEWPDNIDIPYQHQSLSVFEPFGREYIPGVPTSFTTRFFFVPRLNYKTVGNQTWTPFVMWGEGYCGIVERGNMSNLLPYPSPDIKVLNCSISSEPFPARFDGDTRDQDYRELNCGLDSFYPNHHIQYSARLIQETPHWWKQYEQVLV